ncbi:hypothetical protein Dimus_014791, partial [Dionaea muscipula]
AFNWLHIEAYAERCIRRYTLNAAACPTLPAAMPLPAGVLLADGCSAMRRDARSSFARRRGSLLLARRTARPRTPTARRRFAMQGASPPYTSCSLAPCAWCMVLAAREMLACSPALPSCSLLSDHPFTTLLAARGSSPSSCSRLLAWPETCPLAAVRVELPPWPLLAGLRTPSCSLLADGLPVKPLLGDGGQLLTMPPMLVAAARRRKVAAPAARQWELPCSHGSSCSHARSVFNCRAPTRLGSGSRL